MDSTPSKSADDTDLDTPPYTHTSSTKNHHLLPPPPRPAAAYKECMKNHAANIGGYAVDGCGEYMPPPSAVPISLKCAACGCHRNFHRREPESPSTAITPPFLDFRRPGQTQANRTSSSTPHMLVATAAEKEQHHDPATPAAENTLGRKRMRTKFSQEQKEKMHAFSEKVGWRMQKSDAAAVEEFCRGTGVARGVLKVWMHNNKNTFGRKETVINVGLTSLDKSIIHGDSRNVEISGRSDGDDADDDNDNGGRFRNENEGKLRFQHCNNGNSSSP